MAIVIIALLVTSCQHDEFVTLGEAEQADPSYKPAVIFKQLELSEIEDLTVLNRLRLSKKRAFSTEMTEDGGYRLIKGTNFSIKSTGIVFMESQKAITYTFGVNDAENPTRIVNLLVVKTKLTDEYKSYLVDYALTEQDIIHIKNGQLNLFDASEKTTITPFRSGQISFVSGNGAPCYTTVAHIGVERCSESGNHLPGDPDCVPKDAYYYVYMTTELAPCGGGGGGSGGGSGAGGGIGGGAGGPAGGGSSGNDSTPGTIECPGDPSQDQDPTDPKDDSPVFGGGDAATTPVLKDKDEDCQKINEVLNSTDGSASAFKQQLLSYLASNEALNNNRERAVIKIQGIEQLAGGEASTTEPKITIDYGNFTGKMEAFAHNHPEIGVGTLSVFGLDDLEALAILVHEDLLADNFVAFLPTEKGTQYALTIKNADKLLDFFYSRYVDGHLSSGSSFDYVRYVESYRVYHEIKLKYFSPDNPNRKIKRIDANNQNVMKQFLKFLNKADLGVQLFKADENFENFTPVSLENGTVVEGETC